MTENTRDVQLKASMDATGVRAGVEQAKTALGDLSKAAEREGAKAGAGVERAGDGAEKASQKIERETRSMIGSIERATAAFKAGQKGGADYFEQLAKQRGISGDALKPYLDQLRQAEAAQKAASNSLGSMGVSAAQTAAALRQVPAQFTDIVTALASGQQPLTVFLQQGGQLKDAFGGAGNAARALGGYVAGLVNPLTLAGAATVALGAAFLQGQSEAQAFGRALTLSGNAAGETAGRLTQLAAAQATFVGTQGQAAAALAGLAGTGRVARDVLGQAAEAVTRLDRVGVSVDDTVKKFAALGKEPLKALIDLNEAENFLTVSVYRQVKALEEQGRLAEAAAVAQGEYARVGIERAKELEAQLGTLQKAWKGVGELAGFAWDKMLNVGRPVTPQEQLKALESQLTTLESKARAVARDNALAGAMFGGGGGDDYAAAARKALQEQIDALREVIRLEGRRATAQSESAVAAKAAIEADKDAAKVSKELAAQRDRDNAALEKAVGLSGSYQKDLTELSRLRERNLLTEKQYVKAVEDLIKAQPVVREQLDAQAKSQKEAAKALEDLLKAEQQRIDLQAKVVAGVEEQVQKLRDEEAALGLAAAQNISLAAALEKVRIARLEEAHAKATAAADFGLAAQLRAEIEAREKLAGLIDAKEGREAAKKSAEDAAREWKRASDDIERGLTDALIRGFDSGKDMAQSLRDYLVNLFKTAVVKFAVQAVLPQGGVGALLGSQGAGNAGIGGLGSLGGLNSLIGGNASAIGSVLGYGNSLYNLSQGNYGAAAGSAIGAYIGGPIGSVVGAEIGKAVDKIFSGGAGTPHIGADYISNATGGYRPGANEVGIYSAGASVNQNRSQAVEDALKVLTGTGAGLLNSLSTSFGGQANYGVGGYFAADGRDPAQANTRITIGGQTFSSTATRYGVSGAQEGMEAFTAELAGQVRAALRAMDLPDWAKSQLDALGNSAGFEELANAVQTITATKTALEQLGAVMPQLEGLTGSAVDGLLKAMGGIQGLSAAAGAYYESFYTDAEKSALATQQMSQALGSLGLAMPASREAFRSLVEAQDLNTEAGRRAYAELLKLSPAFAALVPATQTLAETAASAGDSVSAAAQRMAEAGRRVLADMADQQGSLQVELLRAQGDLQAAAELERSRAIAKLSEGLSAADAVAAAAAYDLVDSLRKQVDATLAAKSAADQAAQAEAQRVAGIAQERETLEGRLLQQLGDTAALRERELASVDASNRATLQRIFALQDEAAAQQQASQAAAQAAQAAQELASRQAAIASQRDSIQARIDQLLGNTAAIRERELHGIDASNRAHLERLFQLEDEREAAQRAAEASRAAAEAAAESARQAEQLRQAWQTVTDGIYNEVQRIRGLFGNSPQSLAAAQRSFAITTAQARAGDQEAAKVLPGLSQTLLQLAEQSAGSLLDIQRIRAQVAASLEQTGATLVGRYGLAVPKFDVGTNFVPRDMLAMVHQGEAIVPRPFNPAAMGGGNAASSAALVSELRGLRDENKAQALAIVKLQTEIAKLLRKWDGEGIPEERAVA